MRNRILFFLALEIQNKVHQDYHMYDSNYPVFSFKVLNKHRDQIPETT